MANERVKTAWMWLDGSDVRGLSIDADSGNLHWYDVVGCHCTDEETIEQSIAAYLREGPPAVIGPLPADTAAEIELSIGRLSPEP